MQLHIKLVLLLYLLARMYRDNRLNVQMFAGAEGIKAKIRIYDEVVKWVLEKQRDSENQNDNSRLTGFESEDLRQFLTEAALCVMQSGNESARVTMLEARLKDSNNPAAKLIQQARQENASEKNQQDKLLNNLLTAFYIKPASGDKGGSVEFVHKSFSEFLFAERLIESFVDWTTKVSKRQREEDLVTTAAMDKQIYDLLGYGNLTPEIVEYLMGLLAESSQFNDVERLCKLFQRLEYFYFRWCDGEFIDAEDANLPQMKKKQLREQLPERENHLGLRQVDVYTGLNVMILLLELHRYAQTRDNLEDKISYTNLNYADLSNADLSNANLSYANLEAVIWNSDTKWLNARGLHKAVAVSPELAQDSAFAAAVALSQGISWVREGKIEEANNAFRQALNFQPSLNDSAEYWNSICWVGSVHGHAQGVLQICEKAVILDANNKRYQDSRGLAKVLTGDLVGALEDFQATVDSGALDYSDYVKQQRLRWIEVLKSGNNPLTPEELEELREVEG